MNKRTIAIFTLFGCMVLAGMAAVLVLQINDSANAADERAANLERIEIIAALACERGERLQAKKSPIVKDELNKNGFILISTGCQRFVDLVNEDLTFDQDRVMLK